MEGGAERKRSPILADRTPDRGFYRAVGVSVAIHVALLLVLFVGGDLDLRPETPQTYSAGLAGGLPAGLEAQLPDLGGAPPAVDPAAPEPPRPEPAAPKPPPKLPPKGVEETELDSSEEPPDVVLPAPATATPRPTASPTARPTPSPTPEPTATPTPSPKPTAAPKPTPTVTPSPKPKPTATAKPAPTKAKPKPTKAPKPTAKPKPKPEPTKPKAKSTAANPAAETKPKPQATAKPKSPAKKEGAGPTESEAARKAPAAEASGEAGASDRDAQIEAAMARVRRRLEGGGAAAGGSGGGGGVPGGSGSGGVPGGTGIGTGGDGLRGADFLLYYNEMIRRIREAWVWVGGSANLEVEVAFGVTPTGDIVGLGVVRSSGDLSYDQSVLRAVRSVRNLGPPPERHQQTFSDVQLTFRPSDLGRSP